LTPSSLAQDEVNDANKENKENDENVIVDPATNKTTSQRGERSKKVVWAELSTLS
jgi:hypothetical protein